MMNLSELQTSFPPPEWPQFLALAQTDSSCTLSLLINPDIRWFEGHFPEQPVLAGVVQTHWAAQLAQYLFPVGDVFQGVDNLKFQTVILPGQAVELTLNYLSGNLPGTLQDKSTGNPAIKFAYRTLAEPGADAQLCSEGKLLFRHAH